MQQQTEFDCVAKAFVYLAAHLPRDEVLEPVMDETFQYIISSLTNMMTMARGTKQFEGFIHGDVDFSGLDAAIGRSSSNAAAAGMPMSEAEPDIFPCLVIICGSAFAFLKVSSARFGFNVDCNLMVAYRLEYILRYLLYYFYRAMHFSANARSWDRMSSVCPSVRL